MKHDTHNEISILMLLTIGFILGCVLTYSTLSVKYHADSISHRREEEFTIVEK